MCRVLRKRALTIVVGQRSYQRFRLVRRRATSSCVAGWNCTLLHWPFRRLYTIHAWPCKLILHPYRQKLDEVQGSEEYGVVECRFWLSGFVARLGNNQLVSVTSYDEPRPRLLATPPSDNVVSWAVIPPAYTLSRTVEVLLAIGQTINVVDATESEDRMLQNGPFRHICVSPNGKFIALYTDDGKVWVISRDFQDKLSEYATKAKTIPKDMQWCGSDSVVLAWEDEVHMVGPNAVASKYVVLPGGTCIFLLI